MSSFSAASFSCIAKWYDPMRPMPHKATFIMIMVRTFAVRKPPPFGVKKVQSLNRKAPAPYWAMKATFPYAREPPDKSCVFFYAQNAVLCSEVCRQMENIASDPHTIIPQQVKQSNKKQDFLQKKRKSLLYYFVVYDRINNSICAGLYCLPEYGKARLACRAVFWAQKNFYFYQEASYVTHQRTDRSKNGGA